MVMILRNYAQSRQSNNFFPTQSEMSDVYEGITHLLQHFQYLTNKKVSKQKMLQEVENNADDIRSFALFLLDYQGVHDCKFSTQLELLENFAELVFIMGIPFYGAEHRLLEITKNYKLALYAPEKPNVATFIIGNLQRYTSSDFDTIVKRWQTLLDEATIFSLKDLPSSPFTCLYNTCKQH